jgi:hypothetical protein
MTEIKGILPVTDIHPTRSPEERNIRKQLGNVRRYLAKSKADNGRSWWESRITVYEKQLKKAEARAGFIG